MSYVLSARLGAVEVPPPDATSQALGILGVAIIPCMPIALGIAGGMYVGKSAVAPVVGGIVGTLISILMLRSSVLAGNSSFGPRVA